VHAHWFSPSSRERAAKRPFRVSLSFLLDVARFTVVIILALTELPRGVLFVDKFFYEN
jgi:hypothetical protein